MIDNFTLVLIHGLLALAVWRLLQTGALDRDSADQAPLPEPTPDTSARQPHQLHGGAAVGHEDGPNA